MYLYLSRVLKAPAPRTTQVLEINTEWKRDDLLLLLCANLEGPPPPVSVALYPITTKLCPLSDYLVDAVHGYGSALVLIHPFKQFYFFGEEKKKKMFV